MVAGIVIAMRETQFYLFVGGAGGDAVKIVRAGSFDEAVRSLDSDDVFDRVLSFDFSELADYLAPHDLDPLNTAAALRYARLEYDGILTSNEKRTLTRVSRKIERRFLGYDEE